MQLLEYQGKKLLGSLGIPVPRGIVSSSKDEALSSLEEFGNKAVIKIQVPVGGRGKAGGIKIAETIQDVDSFIEKWKGQEFKGFQVNSFLVEEQLSIKQELYMSITLNARAGNMLFMFCSEGGVDIEEVAAKQPEKILKYELHANQDYKEYHFRSILSKYGIKGKQLVQLSRIAVSLYKGAITKDLTLAEINPLVVLESGTVMAADSKIEIDDSALYRQPEYASFENHYNNKLEKEAAEIGVTYIKLDGNVGIIASGAGLAMNSMDLLTKFNLKPANFLETGGGITKELMKGAVLHIMKDENVQGLIINLYGGVNPLVEAAKGIVEGRQSMKRKIPIVVKAQGNQQDQCWEILEENGVPVVKNHKTEDAIKALKELLEVAS